MVFAIAALEAVRDGGLELCGLDCMLLDHTLETVPIQV